MVSRPSHEARALRAERVAWLLGWAVPIEWFELFARSAFSEAEHVFIPAGPAALSTLALAEPFDRVVGYSLGALLLLSNASRVRARLGVDLLAPIFAFPCEEALGGRVARAQVRHLARWLRRDPIAALSDFYARAGLDVVAEPSRLLKNGLVVAGVPDPGKAPGSGTPATSVSADLLWGLERLERDRVSPSLPAGWHAWCGADDALLDAAQLHAIEPRIEIVLGATHHPAELIKAMIGSPLGC